MAIHYMFSLLATEGVLGRVYLNDIPAMMGMVRGHITASSVIAERLLTGENTLALEVLRAPADGEFTYEIYALEGDDPDKPTARTIHHRKFSEVRAGLDEKARRVPYWDVSTFTIDTPLPDPPYWKASVEPIPCDGNPDLHAAVHAVHAAADQGDADRLCDLMRAQHEHLERSMNGLAGSSRADSEQSVRTFFSKPTRVEPLRLDDIVFSPRAGGRVAHARRADGAPILYAEQVDDTHSVLAVRDMFLARITDSAWSVI